MNEGLSERQQRMLDFIRRYLVEHGYPPSNREIGRATGISSTSVVDYNLRRMESKGILTCEAKVSRGIRLTGRITSYPLPVVGYIAAGEPIEALEDVTETVSLTSDLAADNCYILKVKGKSMIEDLIDDGDLVVVQPQPVAQNGDIVVAILEDNQATLKRFYREPGKASGGSERIRLQPANSQMEPIYRSPDQVQIRGKVVTVIRQIR